MLHLLVLTVANKIHENRHSKEDYQEGGKNLEKLKRWRKLGTNFFGIEVIFEVLPLKIRDE